MLLTMQPQSPTQTVRDRQALELAIYLASLVSEVRAIDPMLDPVRQITARLAPGAPMPPDDQKTLEQVCHDLEDYLTTREKLRVFSPEQLQERITDFTHGAEHRSLRRVLAVMAGVAVVFILAVVFAPFALSPATRGLTASSIFFMMVHLTAAWFFISALKTFAPTLRQAYLLIASGVVILGLTQIVQPVVNILNLQSTPYNTLFSVLPLIPAYVFMFEGARRFAKVLQRQSRWLGPLTIVVGLIIALPLGLLIPHVSSGASEELLDIIFALQIVNVTVVVVLTALLARIVGSLTTLYARPVRLLLVFAVISIGIGAYMLVVNALTGGIPSELMLIPLIVAIIANGFILLRAGYDFKRASMR